DHTKPDADGNAAGRRRWERLTQQLAAARLANHFKRLHALVRLRRIDLGLRASSPAGRQTICRCGFEVGVLQNLERSWVLQRRSPGPKVLDPSGERVADSALHLNARIVDFRLARHDAGHEIVWPKLDGAG